MKVVAGQKYEMLKAIEPTDMRSGTSVIWKCECDCKTICYVPAYRLTLGRKKSCGCLEKENKINNKLPHNNKVNLIDMVFGSLKVKDQFIKDEETWCVCECSCGKFVNVRAHSLRTKNTVSCGHEKSIQDTSIHAIKSAKRSDNSSGYTGVYWRKDKQKWEAKIWFKKKLYRLGYHRDINDAIAARKIAEQKLFGEFLQWYDEIYRH